VWWVRAVIAIVEDAGGAVFAAVGFAGDQLRWQLASCNVHCVISINITLTKLAYDRLKKLKEPGESFSQMVMRELPERLATCGELEDYFAKQGVPKANPKLEQAMLSGRGRRSKRGKL